MSKITEMHERIDEPRCPICDDWTLDTGGECDKCGYDRQHVMTKQEFTKAWLKVRNKPKMVKVEFLRNHGNHGGRCE